MSEDNELKTGTTTIGLVCKDSIVLAADKRATAGNLIANKKMKKVHPIGDKMALTTSGSVSDIQRLIKIITAEMKLKDIRSKRGSTVKEAANLLANLVYRNVRQFFPGVTHFLFSGFDDELHLYDIFPDGSVAEIEDYVASGSGSVFAYGVLESQYEEGLTQKKGVELAKEAVFAAMERDAASGNGIDVFVITEDGVEEAFSKIVETSVE